MPALNNLGQILSTSSAAVDSSDYQINVGFAKTGLAQVVISAAATVNIQGRLSSSLAYVTLATVTATGIAVVPICPEMRASVTGNTGTVTVDLLTESV